MGFGTLKIKAKAKSGRGSVDAAAIEEAVIEMWDEIVEATNNLAEDEQTDMKKHFNEFLANDDVDNLGDLLFGEVEDFKQAVATLSTEDKTKFFNEILKQGVLDEDSLTAAE